MWPYFGTLAGWEAVVAVAGLAHDPIRERGDHREEHDLRKRGDDPCEVLRAQSGQAWQGPQEEAKVQAQQLDVD